MVGGGHAHCGMAIYLGDSFPDSYYGDLFFNNLHGHRIVRESVSTDGSGYVGHHRPDLVRSVDHAFVGVSVMLGPDGSLFFSDWHDPQTCHNRDPEIWDRSNGRVFRLRYGDKQSTAIDLVDASDAELIEMLPHRNAMIARQAAHLLHQRSAAGTLDRGSAIAEFESLARKFDETRVRLRMLWARHCCGMVDTSEMLGLMKDADPYVRGWAIQLFAEQSDRRTAEDWVALAEATRGESSLVPLRYLASALQRIPLAHRSSVASNVTSHPLFDRDKNLPLLVWYAIEPLVAEQPEATLTQFSSDAPLRQKMVRRAASSESGRNALAASLANSTSYDALVAGVTEMKQWLPESTKLKQPPQWDQVRELGDQLIAKRGNDEKQLFDNLRQLGARLGDAKSFPYYRSRAVDKRLDADQRRLAIDLLRQAGDDQAGKIAASVLGEPPMREVAVRTIVAAGDASVASIVIDELAKLPLGLRSDLINYLATRASTASTLVSAIESGKLDRSLVSAVLLRQIQSHEDDDLQARVQQIWGRIGDEPGNYPQQKKMWSEILSPDRLRHADIEHGRFVFDQVCGNCHKLFGEGKEIGPDLTGSNRKDLNYILENVLAPNAIIGNAYQMHAFLMDDGRLITGLVREETENAIRVVMSAGTEVTLAPSEIETRKLSEQSMMPMELLDKMPRADVIDLVVYLANDKQVPPKEKRTLRPGEVDPSNLIEAEWLLDSAHASTGSVRRQDMRGFAGEWSGDAQLWWTGSNQGGTLELKVASPHHGPCDVTIHLTTAVDYPIMRAKVNDQPWQTADLYSKEVRQLAQPLRWQNVPMDENQELTLTFEMTGANPVALKRWMLGIDRIEVIPRNEKSN